MALHEIYLLPFMLTNKNAKPSAVMTSDNAVNGMSVSDNGEVLDILRKCGRPNSIFGPKEKDAGMKQRLGDSWLRYCQMTQNSKPLCAGKKMRKIAL